MKEDVPKVGAPPENGTLRQALAELRRRLRRQGGRHGIPLAAVAIRGGPRAALRPAALARPAPRSASARRYKATRPFC